MPSLFLYSGLAQLWYSTITGPMEISVTRGYDKNKKKVNGFMDWTDWISYIRRSPFLPVDTEQSRGRNPKTGEEMLIAPQTDIGYFVRRGKPIAIKYDDGELWAECEWDDTANLVLGQIAKDSAPNYWPMTKIFLPSNPGRIA